MNLRAALLLAATGISLTETARAQDTKLQYSYVEFGFTLGIPDQSSLYLFDPDFGELTADVGESAVFDIKGSYLLNEYFFAEASIDLVKQDATFADDFSSLTVDYNTTVYSFGIGARFPLVDNVDAYGVLGFAKLDRDVSPDELENPGADNDGFTYRLGLRARATEMIELGVAYEKYDITDAYGDLNIGEAALKDGVGAELRFHLNPQFSLGLNLDKSDDVTNIGAGARFGF